MINAHCDRFSLVKYGKFQISLKSRRTLKNFRGSLNPNTKEKEVSSECGLVLSVTHNSRPEEKGTGIKNATALSALLSRKMMEI